MKNIHHQELTALFTQIVQDESPFTEVKGVTLFRVEKSFEKTPISYNSEIVFLLQGSKRVYLGKDIFTYDSSHYLVLPVPLPCECEGVAEAGKPILGLSVTVDLFEIGQMVQVLDCEYKTPQSLPRGMYSAPLGEALFDAIGRLLRSIVDPLDRRVLVPMIKREIVYRVMQSEKGEILKAAAYHNKTFFQIAKVLNKIHDTYGGHFDIRQLATDHHMSSSTFHTSFKSVTGLSPLQYIKNVRLHKARSLMIQDGLNVNTAALKVGYESASQFNREYKRLFGITPARDVSAIGRI